MEPISGFIGMLMMVLVVVLVAALALLGIMRIKDNEDAAFADIIAGISYCRKRRYIISTQMITTYASPQTPSAPRLTQLVASYPKVSNDAAETAWEKDFLPLMKSFLIEAQHSVPAQMLDTLKSSVSEFTANEQDLREFRRRYYDAQIDRQRYERPPLSIALALAGIFIKASSAGVDTYNQARSIYGDLQDSYNERKRREEDLFYDNGTESGRR